MMKATSKLQGKLLLISPTELEESFDANFLVFTNDIYCYDIDLTILKPR